MTRARLLALALSLLLAAVAWGAHNRFLQDDAYISFRYAANLVHHGELNWNPGERPQIEGYTNFLWTLLLAGAIALGLPPGGASQAFGLALGAGTLLLTFRLARGAEGSDRAALLALLLLGGHYSFSAYMTGGLETPLQVFLLIAACVLAAETAAEGGPPGARVGPRRLIALSLLLGLGFLTRMDAALTGAVIWLFTARALAGRLPERARLARALGLLTLPGALLAGAWLAWKLATYGGLFPTSWYLKGAGASWEAARGGVGYLALYGRAYALLPALALVAWQARELWRVPAARLALLLLPVWCAYVARVGGDFMEFRFCVPAAPLLLLLVAHALDRLRRAAVRWTLAAVLLGASFAHAATFRSTADVESIAALEAHLTAPEEQWLRAGEILGEALRGSGVVIATTASGAVPYASGLTTVDMLGVSDPWVARHGAPLGGRPGHSRVATVDYLRRRGVNLVVAHPQVRAKSGGVALDLPSAIWSQADPAALPAATRVLQIPLDGDRILEVLYLSAHPAVDAAIAARGWRVLPATLSNRWS